MPDVTPPLVQHEYLLQRFPGKGGWTYAAIPEVPMDPHAHFGWVCVRGSIDHHCFEQARLMPLGNGQLFLPVNASIRKKIGKAAGDQVNIILYPDQIRGDIPEELAACLQDEPLAWQRFQHFSPESRKKWVDAIFDCKKPEARARKIVELIEHLLRPGSSLML